MDKLSAILRAKTDEELRRLYANNSPIDWYKCNLIIAEMERRKLENPEPWHTI